MSGICGFTTLAFDGERKNISLKMAEKIKHRGPDANQIFMDNNLALAFNDLNLNDTPFEKIITEDGNFVTVLDGIIYNAGELQIELVKEGASFATNKGSEVILEGYKIWGLERLLNKLRGSFAFIIYNKNEKSLFGARDHFGMKPLFYTTSDGALVFASEIKSILEYPGYHKKLNIEALESYLSFQYSSLETTFFKNIFQLPAAHYFIYKDNQLEIKRYWKATMAPEQDMKLEEAIEAIDKVVNESVSLHNQADIEVGSFLSSGVDSSLIVSLARPEKSFTIGFGDERYNEIPYARRLSNALNVENINQTISGEEYWGKLPEIQYMMDEPLADPSAIGLYFVSRLASKHVKVVLSGEGADEFFGGYNIYHEPTSLSGYQKIPKTLRKYVAKIAGNYLPSTLKGRSFLLRGAMDLEERFIGNANMFSYEERCQILKKTSSAPSPSEVTEPYYIDSQHLDSVSRMQLIDINLWLRGNILLKADRMSMAHSLEIRSPLLDKEVYEVAHKLPSKLKIHGTTTKYAFRQSAIRYLPEVNAQKKKLGFPIPIRKWLREDIYYEKVKEAFSSDIAEEFFDTSYVLRLLKEHYDGKYDHSRKIWVIYMFIVWYRVYFI
ncbi:MAG: asparagine synthase (glutamine-hydrolyzing) [Mammaliicoccus vitulinus]